MKTEKLTIPSTGQDMVTLTFDANDVDDIRKALHYMQGFLDGKAPIQTEDEVCVYCEYDKRYGTQTCFHHGKQRSQTG